MKIYTFYNTKDHSVYAFVSSKDTSKLPVLKIGENWKFDTAYELDKFKKKVISFVPDIDINRVIEEIEKQTYSIGKIS